MGHSDADQAGDLGLRVFIGKRQAVVSTTDRSPDFLAEMVERAVAAGETVYGVTTGFGSLANVAVPAAEASALQHAIVRSHATAVGPFLPREEARAMLLLRAHVLAFGNSGVRVEIIEGEHLCRKGEGGPTCLTRPLTRS